MGARSAEPRHGEMRVLHSVAMYKVSHRESSTVVELGAWCHHGPSKLALISNQSRILNPSPGSFLRNTCWQAGPAELEAEDLDEALADARVLRNWLAGLLGCQVRALHHLGPDILCPTGVCMQMAMKAWKVGHGGTMWKA